MLHKGLSQRLPLRTQARWAFDRPWLKITCMLVVGVLALSADAIEADAETIENVEMAILAL